MCIRDRRLLDRPLPGQVLGLHFPAAEGAAHPKAAGQGRAVGRVEAEALFVPPLAGDVLQLPQGEPRRGQGLVEPALGTGLGPLQVPLGQVEGGCLLYTSPSIWFPWRFAADIPWKKRWRFLPVPIPFVK